MSVTYKLMSGDWIMLAVLFVIAAGLIWGSLQQGAEDEEDDRAEDR